MIVITSYICKDGSKQPVTIISVALAGILDVNTSDVLDTLGIYTLSTIVVLEMSLPSILNFSSCILFGAIPIVVSIVIPLDSSTVRVYIPATISLLACNSIELLLRIGYSNATVVLSLCIYT